MALLDDLGDILTSGSTGVFGTDILVGRMPDTPAVCLSLAETGGLTGSYTLQTGPAFLERPRVQVLSRALTSAAAHARSKMVETVLDGLRNRTKNGTLYHWAQAVQPAFLMEYDANQRPVLAQNFEIQKARSTA